MNALARLIVRVADLAEAEGRALRFVAFRFAIALGLLVLTTLLAGTAAAFFIVAILLALAYAMHSWPGAFAIMGVIVLVLTAALMGIAVAIRNKRVT